MASNNRLCKAILAARNAYDYPSVGLALRDASASDWRGRYEPHTFRNSLHLDHHHTRSLNSQNDDDVLNGIFSVMYWGNITAGKKCETRCDWLERGNKRFPNLSLRALGPLTAIAAVRKSVALLKGGHYEEALDEIRLRLPFVGPSFGSKYLAFLDPERIGVLDLKILKHLHQGTFDELLGGHAIVLKKARSPAKRFARFCLVLNELRDLMKNKALRWKDKSGASAEFRAIDVERALFALAKSA